MELWSFFSATTSTFSFSAKFFTNWNVILTVFNIALSFFALWVIFSETSIKWTEPFVQPHAIILPDSCGFTHFIEWSEICKQRKRQKMSNFSCFSQLCSCHCLPLLLPLMTMVMILNVPLCIGKWCWGCRKWRKIAIHTVNSSVSSGKSLRDVLSMITRLSFSIAHEYKPSRLKLVHFAAEEDPMPQDCHPPDWGRRANIS